MFKWLKKVVKKIVKSAKIGKFETPSGKKFTGVKSKFKFAYLIFPLAIALAGGCATIGLQEVINPAYEAKLKEIAQKDPMPTKEEIEEALKGIPKLVTKERLTLKGMKSSKKIKFTSKAEIEDKSGLADLMPDIEIDASDLMKD